MGADRTLNVPLHVSPLGATKREDPSFCEDVKGERVDTLLVDDDESFRLLLSINSLVTDKTLELDDLLDFLISETALRLDELFALFGRRVEEARVDLTAAPLNEWLRNREVGTYVFSYSKLTFKVRMKAFSTRFGMSGCLAP